MSQAWVQRWHAALRCERRRGRRLDVGLHMQHIAGSSARPPWPPNLPSVNVAALPRYSRHIDAAAHGEIGARTSARHGAEFQHLPRL